jgi:hypothetical protein
VPHSSKATYGGMAHSAIELMVVLTNLAPVGHRGESCTCLGVASRVDVWEPPVLVAVRTLTRGCSCRKTGGCTTVGVVVPCRPGLP